MDPADKPRDVGDVRAVTAKTNNKQLQEQNASSTQPAVKAKVPISIFEAASTGDLDTLRLLLEQGVDVDTKDPASGNTALMFASEKGHTVLVEILLTNGADVHAENNYKRTGLLWASAKGHTETVEVLLKVGADVNHKCHKNDTALIFSSQNGHTNTVEILLKHGADVSTQAGIGKHGALLLAAREGHTSIVELLLTYGADINTVSNKRRTPSEVAIAYNHPETALAIKNFDFRRCLTLAHSMRDSFLADEATFSFEQVVRQFNVLSSQDSELSAEAQLDLACFYQEPKANQPLEVIYAQFLSVSKKYSIQYKKAQFELANLTMVQYYDDQKIAALEQAMAYAIEAEETRLVKRIHNLLCGKNGFGEANELVLLILKNAPLSSILKLAEQERLAAQKEKILQDEINMLKAKLASVSSPIVTSVSNAGFFAKQPKDVASRIDCVPSALHADARKRKANCI